MEQAKDVIEARSQFDAEHPTFWPMLVVLGIREHIKLQDREPLAGKPKNVLVKCK